MNIELEGQISDIGNRVIIGYTSHRGNNSSEVEEKHYFIEIHRKTRYERHFVNQEELPHLTNLIEMANKKRAQKRLEEKQAREDRAKRRANKTNEPEETNEANEAEEIEEIEEESESKLIKTSDSEISELKEDIGEIDEIDIEEGDYVVRDGDGIEGDGEDER